MPEASVDFNKKLESSKRQRPGEAYDRFRIPAAAVPSTWALFEIGKGKVPDVFNPTAGKSYASTNVPNDGQLQSGQIGRFTAMRKSYAPRSTALLDSDPDLQSDIRRFEGYINGFATYWEIKIAQDNTFLAGALMDIPSAWNKTYTGGNQAAYNWVNFTNDCPLWMTNKNKVTMNFNTQIGAVTTLPSGLDLIIGIHFTGVIFQPPDWEAWASSFTETYGLTGM